MPRRTEPWVQDLTRGLRINHVLCKARESVNYDIYLSGCLMMSSEWQVRHLENVLKLEPVTK